MIESSFLPFVLAASAGLTVALFVLGLVTMRSPVRAVQGRMQALAATGSIYAGDEPTLLKNQGGGLLNLGNRLDRLVSIGTAEALERSGLPLRVGEYVTVRLFAIALGGAMGVLVARLMELPVAVGITLGLLLGLLAPPLFVRAATKQRSAAIEPQIAEMCDLVASMMRSGFGYTQALGNAAEEMDPPLSIELMRLLGAVRLGGDLDEAMAQLNHRLNSADFDMMATAVSIQRRSGGNLSEILAGVAETIRHRQSFRLELAALTSRERFSAVIIAMLPFVLVLFLSVMDPIRYALLFTDPRGQILLAISISLDLAGYLVIKQLSRVEV